jgi:hypothetical protein
MIKTQHCFAHSQKKITACIFVMVVQCLDAIKGCVMTARRSRFITKTIINTIDIELARLSAPLVNEGALPTWYTAQCYPNYASLHQQSPRELLCGIVGPLYFPFQAAVIATLFEQL